MQIDVRVELRGLATTMPRNPISLSRGANLTRLTSATLTLGKTLKKHNCSKASLSRPLLLI